MAELVIDEKALQADIDEARARVVDTKELYKWVCSLLFFRYGITPTTNRLYQLVRKGSMQTVTTALSTFWQDLREKSRIKIEHPGVPESLIAVTGDMIAAIWEKASLEAKSQFDAALAEAHTEVEATRSLADEAKRSAIALGSSVTALQTKIDQARAALTTANSEIQMERHAHAASAARFETVQVEARGLRDALADARKDFAIQLDKAREAVQLSEERLRAAERRALLEIDRERDGRTAAESVASDIRARTLTAESKFNERLQAQALDLGAVRGKLEAVGHELEKREAQNATLRQQSVQLEVRCCDLGSALESSRTELAAVMAKL